MPGIRVSLFCIALFNKVEMNQVKESRLHTSLRSKRVGVSLKVTQVLTHSANYHALFLFEDSSFFGHGSSDVDSDGE